MTVSISFGLDFCSRIFPCHLYFLSNLSKVLLCIFFFLRLHALTCQTPLFTLTVLELASEEVGSDEEWEKELMDEIMEMKDDNE